MYDIAIIGAGPAGLSAAITARARNKDVLVISNKPQESPLAKASLIDNYPGMPQTSGLDLINMMVEQAIGLGAAINYGRVISALPMGGYFALSVGDEIVEARAVILAAGTQPGKAFKGESEFLGRGVSYCATCDGMLYRNSVVCVVGLNSESVKEANFLKEIGAEVVFLAKKAPQGLSEHITVKHGSVAEIQGDMMGVTGLVYRPAAMGKGEITGTSEEADTSGEADADRETANEEADAAEVLDKTGATNETESITCNGVFILRPSIAPDALIAGLELKDGYIAVDENMRTNIPGIFAAGDCVGRPLQVAKAVGEGLVACLSAAEYLD